MDLSIVIPTLEEEKYLPLLLRSIKKQNFSQEYEIIVADAGSKDRTVEIAKSEGCMVIQGGLPAYGRNKGAKVAKGKLILFADADIIFPDNSLEQFVIEFEKRSLDLAGFLLRPCGNNRLLEMLYDVFYNIPAFLMEKILPHSVGAIMIKSRFYEKIGGFDEEIKIGEDHIYSRKAFRVGKFGLLKSFKIYYSQRRFKRDGLVRTYLKYFLAELYLVFLGPIKSDIFQYDLQVRRFKD